MGADARRAAQGRRRPCRRLAVARALAAELKDGGYDLILFGKVAADTATGTVGPMVAELLGLPCVTGVSKLEIAGGKGTAHRDARGRRGDASSSRCRRWSRSTRGSTRPRYPSLKGIMAAKKKPLEIEARAARRRRA